MCIYYIDFILLYNLQQDLVAYDHLLHGSVNSWEQIGALGLQGIGSNCMYAMGMLVGAYIIRFVPEVASWLIPGGVSSGTGSVAGSAAMGITSAAGAMAGGAAGLCHERNRFGCQVISQITSNLFKICLLNPLHRKPDWP